MLAVPPVAHAATITVTTTADNATFDSTCSLREAIQAANTNATVDACAAGQSAPTVDVITFALGSFPTILLASTLPSTTEAVTIDGATGGAAFLTISGQDAVRVMQVAAGANLNLKGVRVVDGSVGTASGGGIVNNGTLTVTNATFSGNSAPSGGAIHGVGTTTITNSTFSGNSAIANGGAIYNDGSLTITNSTFSGNFVSGGGGAIFSDGLGFVNTTNSTFSGNSAGDGGGAMWIDGIGATVTNTTFSANSASNLGGAAIVAFEDTTLRNTLVAPSGNGASNCYGERFIDGGGNLSWLDTTCPGVNQDPLLDPAGLQNNGGPTQTIALLQGSPAIDTAIAANCPATDQRGVSRPQGPGCDIGTFEREQDPTSVALRFFTVKASTRGVMIRWRTWAEAEIVGFNVYRQQQGKLVKLNRTLIPSVFGGTASGHRYSWLDRGAPSGRSVKYRLQAVSLSGKRSWVGTAVVAR